MKDPRNLDNLIKYSELIQSSWNHPQHREPLLSLFFNLMEENALKEPLLLRYAKAKRKIMASGDLPSFIAIHVGLKRYQQAISNDTDKTLSSQADQLPGKTQSLPVTVLCENIRSAFNVGAIVRTCEFFSIESIVFAGYTPTPDHPKTKKTTMGCESYIPWTWRPSLTETINHFKANHIPIIALETVPSAPSLSQFTFPQKCAIIIGNENHGLEPQQVKTADDVIQITSLGWKNSLNVVTALGICLHEYYRQRQ